MDVVAKTPAQTMALTLAGPLHLGRFGQGDWSAFLARAAARRLEDSYFRQVLQAPTRNRLALRLGGLRWRYQLESPLANVLMWRAVARRKGGVPDLDGLYEGMSDDISRLGVDDDIKQGLDYLAYTQIRCFSALLNQENHGLHGVRFADLLNLVRSVAKVELLNGAAMLPVLQPDVSYEVHVLRDIIERAIAALDSHVALLSRLGYLE